MTWAESNGSYQAIYVRKFDTTTASVTGALEGWSWPVNSGGTPTPLNYTASNGSDPAIAKLGTGIFVVWREAGSQIRIKQVE